MILKKGLDLLQGLAGRDGSDPLFVKHEVCRAAEGGISQGAEGKRLAGDYLLVRLVAEDSTRAAFEAQLVRERALEKAVRSHLRQEGCADTEKLRVEVEFVEELRGGKPFGLKWYRREASARLTVLKGRALRKLYNLENGARRIFIGRAAEVVDKHGFPVRRNDVVFENVDDEVNGSVSRRHGWLQFDEAAQSFRLFDPESKQGTRVERDGRVRRVSPAGETLRDGDIIYSGKARMRFSLKVRLNEC